MSIQGCCWWCRLCYCPPAIAATHADDRARWCVTCRSRRWLLGRVELWQLRTDLNDWHLQDDTPETETSP